MLAWRAATRPTSSLSRNFQAPRRRIIHNASFSARPAGLASKFFFRKDGTPRSKVKGLVIGAAAFSTLTLMYAMLDLIHEYDQTNYLLTCLIHIQRADGDFGAVDLLEPSAALSYFRELCSSFTDVPPDVIDNFFQDVTRLVRSQGEPAVKAHTVLREVSEKVHEILVKSKGAEAWDTAVDVIRTLDGAIIDLADLVEEAVGEDDDGKFVMYQRIKEQKAKDPGSRSNDYDIIG
ncbi:uncharacterized protein LACBIDRAFT_304683 [Laccaria bicolor S238N-H82]|uniref:Predicted protein n=1 Tax=Laccaria bicolor (strain S238N-H82 / ATCC MYA-4686) TaxID=486041 RepID=B0DM53_LACBS|nr:uncharacterized protein LACBIDRAFT_304683 [Laccaria bicolor S238N-H82]EDR04413.1 predicted protein [Laccaria bicolor S238N-H82]|eukprot:XP_001884932.1 predicted protein [Laccaria bicolor S238N-H82]